MSCPTNNICRIEHDEGLTMVRFDNPPVNAISQAVRDGIVEALAQANARSSRAVVFYAVGRTFFSGADIREFDQPSQRLDLPQTLDAMDRCQIPLLALLHGTVLGGGLEFALRCDQRLAHRKCRFGFPEVNLGLIPGAGGTQLLPRLIGIEKALDMVCQGKMIDCPTARAYGLVDAILPVDEIDPELWLKWLKNAITDHQLSLRKNQLRNHPPPPAPAEQQVQAQRQSLIKKARGQSSPLDAFNSVIDGLGGDIENGLRHEREIFLSCKKSMQSRALRYVFFAEKNSVKLDQRTLKKTASADLTACAVVGCGTMGARIGSALLRTGLSITMIDTNQANLNQAREVMHTRLDKMRDRHQIGPEQHQQQRDRLVYSQDLTQGASQAQLVIEAVYEDAEIKRQVFTQLDQCVAPETILATNTSYIDPQDIFAAVSHPERLVGLHFFSPADVMKLLEIVVLPHSNDRTLATALTLAKAMGKIPVFAQPKFGFIANRSYMAYGQAGQSLLLSGNTPEQIDRAMTDFGMAMGPCAVLDMSGIDIGHQGRQHDPNPPTDPDFFLPARILVERGELGRKTGRGFYQYQDGKPCGMNQQALQVIQQRARELGIKPQPATADHIAQTMIEAIAREGGRLVQSGVCQRESDIDVIWVNGYGFPRYLGGPMFHCTQTNSSTP